MSAKIAPRHRRRNQLDTAGGASGNERLTAMTGAVLLLLLAVEGVTIVFKRELLTLHFFFGMLLVGPLVLKIGSTGYRFVRYYAGSAPYVRRGPPALLLRLLGPIVIATSAGVIGVRHRAGDDRPAGAAMDPDTQGDVHPLVRSHVGARALVRAAAAETAAGGFTRARPVSTILAGAGRRWLLLASALAVGLVLAMATYHLAGSWTGQLAQHG